MKCSACDQEATTLVRIKAVGEERFFPRCERHDKIKNMKRTTGVYEGKKYVYYTKE